MKARSRDRQVYLRSHPVLFALLAATRRRGVQRLGIGRPSVQRLGIRQLGIRRPGVQQLGIRQLGTQPPGTQPPGTQPPGTQPPGLSRPGGTILVHERDAYVEVLTRLPLDRTAAGTTGGAAGLLTDGDVLFDQQGEAHRRGRRELGDSLSSAGVERLRPVWRSVLDRRLTPLAAGEQVDLVPLAAELAGATAAALLGLDADPIELASAAREAAATTARAHLPGLRRRGAGQAAEQAAARLTALVAPQTSLAAIITVAAITTTVAALPRAAAWAADADLWAYADRQSLADELLRVTAPTPLLPRVAAAPGSAGGCPVNAGDRLLLIARHAVDAHRTDPNPLDPAPAHVAQLVFGAGPHACPGARLARTQLADLLAALAPHRPRVVRARADRHAALPSWRTLVIEATSKTPGAAGPVSAASAAGSAGPAAPQARQAPQASQRRQAQ